MDAGAALLDPDWRGVQSENLGWLQPIAVYSRADLRKSLCQITDTLVPYIILWALMIAAVQRGYPYWITLTLPASLAEFWCEFLFFFMTAAMGPIFRRGLQISFSAISPAF
jgi:hypothetical protein